MEHPISNLFFLQRSKMYSLDFRHLALRLYSQMQSLRKVADLLSIGIATLSRWKTRVTPRRRRSSLSPVIHLIEAHVKGMLMADPFLTCTDVAHSVNKTFKLRVSRKNISRIVKRVGITRKKCRLKVVRPDAQQRVDTFKQQIRRLSLTDHIIAIDESGFKNNECPMFGYAEKGKRLYVHRKNGSWKHWSLVMAIDTRGQQHHGVSCAPVNTESFMSFLQTIHKPPGSVIIMDNVAFHRTKRVTEYLSKCGCSVIFAPPYHPDFNPIEYIFSHMKTIFRGTAQKTMDLVSSIATRVPSSLMMKCFRHVMDICR